MFRQTVSSTFCTSVPYPLMNHPDVVPITGFSFSHELFSPIESHERTIRSKQSLRALRVFAVQCLDYGTMFTLCSVTDPFVTTGVPSSVVVPDWPENDVSHPPWIVRDLSVTVTFPL